MTSDFADLVLEAYPASDLIPTYVSDSFSIDLKIAFEELEKRDQAAVSLWLAGYTQEEIGKPSGVSQQAVSLTMIRAFCEMGTSLG